MKPKNQRHLVMLAAFTAAALLGFAAGAVAPPVRAQTPPPRPPAFGLVHVDLMDLHVERLPGGGVRERDLLPAADMADRFAKAAAAGAGWNRWSMYWDMIEQPDGAWRWAAADGIVDRDVGAGLRTLAILQGTPGRDATRGSHTAAVPKVGGHHAGAPDASGMALDRATMPVQASPPRGMEQPIFRRADGSKTDDPAQAASINPDNPWARFVDAAVERYRPGGELARARGWPAGAGVRAWEIGNEPNLAFFWSGTPVQFLRYLEVAALVIRWRDPAAVIVHGGIADDASASAWYGQFADALRARAAASDLPGRYGYYFDKAGWHWYTYPSLLQTGPVKARALLSDRGLPVKPIWVTEMGVPIWNEHPGPCWDPTSSWRASAAEQAGYIWQAFAEGEMAAVEVMLHFQLYDDCGNGPASYDAFGVVRNHASNQCWTPPQGQSCWRFDPALAGTPRPGFDAFRVAAAELDGALPLWRPPREADFWQRVLLYRPPDMRVTVVWNLLRADRAVELFATGPEATIYSLDAAGTLQQRRVAPEGGKHTVTLPGATNRNNPGSQSSVMGGRPVILVERDTAAPFRAQVEALPPESGTRFDLTVSAADGGTGVGAYQVFAATAPPARVEDWQPVGGETAWPGAPLSASITVPFTGQPGRTYYFAARARDRAGNWSALPLAPQAQTRVAGVAPTADAATPTAPRTATSTLISPSPTRPPVPSTTPVPSITSTPSSTLTPSTTPTPSTTSTRPPIVDTAFLPLGLLRHTWPGIPEATPTVATPDCEPVRADVRGPRGDDLAGRTGGRWTLVSRSATGMVDERSAPLGEAICPPPSALRREAWAELPGYQRYPPQNLANGTRLHLSALPGAIVGGAFEPDTGGLAAWTLGGSTPPRLTGSEAALSGAGAVVLGQDFRGQPELGGGGNSTLGQELRVPTQGPTLSLDYRFDSRETCGGGRCSRLDRIEVIVVELESPDLPAHYLTGLDGLREPTERWTHLWYDLSPWAGKRVRVMLNLYQPDATDPSRAWFDNVAVGPDEPEP
jgi:hypothetical protein